VRRGWLEEKGINKVQKKKRGEQNQRFCCLAVQQQTKEGTGDGKAVKSYRSHEKKNERFAKGGVALRGRDSSKLMPRAST